MDYSQWIHKESDTTKCPTSLLRVQISSINWGEITSFAIRPQFPDSQKHVSWLFQSCVKTHLGHTVHFHKKRYQESVQWMLLTISVVTLMRWKCTMKWFPSRNWQAACCFQKIQKLDQICCNEEKNEPVCFSGKLKGVTIQLSQWENTSFSIRSQSPDSQKHVSLQFQSCVKRLLGHRVPFLEKRC